MAIIRDPSNPARILKINEDGSINVVAVLTELEVKNDAGNPLNVTDAAFGTAGGTTAPPNGTGTLGWLRGIFDKLASTLTADISDRPARALGAVSGTITANQGTAGAQAWPVFLDAATLAALETIQVGNFPTTQQIAGTVALDSASLAALEQITATLSGPGTSEALPIYAFERPANLKAKQVSAANTAQTVTLPAVASQFHYIVGIIVQRYNSTATAVAGAAANLAVTTTNLGGIEFRFGNAVVSGGGDTPVNLQPSNPLKSDTAGAATTVVVPALGAGIISVVNVIYFTAP